MAIRKLVSTFVTSITESLVAAPVKGVVDELFERHPVAQPEDVQRLEAEVKRLQEALERTHGQLAELQESLAQSQDQSSEAHLKETIQEILKTQSPAEPKPAAPAPRVCKVDGCDSPVKARGFCSRHYSSWRRGTLAAYVGPEGWVIQDEFRAQVDEQWAGMAFSVQGEGEDQKVTVDGQEITHQLA